MQFGALNNAIQIGGAHTSAPGGIIPITDLVNWKTMGVGVGSTTAANYLALGHLGAQYQITNGLTAVAPGFFLYNSAAGDIIDIGYADTALAAVDTNTAPTNPKSLWTPSNTVAQGGFRATATTNAPVWYPIPLKFPSQKYPYIRVNAAGSSVAMTIIFKEI